MNLLLSLKLKVNRLTYLWSNKTCRSVVKLNCLAFEYYLSILQEKFKVVFVL